MGTSKLSELLKSADFSQTITVDAPSLTKEGVSAPLYIDKNLGYDIIILLETTPPETIVNSHTKNDKHFKVAEISVNAEKITKHLKRLVQQKNIISGEKRLNSLQHWLRTTTQKASRVIFSISLLTNRKKNKYFIHYRENTGNDIRTNQPSLASCITESGKLKTQKNYMICIEVNNRRIKRWDREIFGNGAKWRSCPPDRFEILGELTLTYKVTKE